MTRRVALFAVLTPLLAAPAAAQEAPPHAPSTTAQGLLAVGKPVVGTDGQEVGRIVEVTRAPDGQPTGVLLEASRSGDSVEEGQMVEVPLDLLFSDDGVVIGLNLSGATGPGEPEISHPEAPRPAGPPAR